MDVLGREEGFEHVFLSFGKRCEVDAPICVIMDAFVGRYKCGVVCWAGWLDGRCKVVAVHVESHGYTGVDLGAFRTIDVLGDVIVGTDAVGIEAAQERLDGRDFALYPSAGVECEFNVGFIEEKTGENGDGEKWDDDFEGCETRSRAYPQSGRTRFMG